MAELFAERHTPDVLLCLANLSNDEVFTPPDIANQVLDMLPQALFRDPTTKFLDPACKSGVFLREIAKRLIEGLEDKIPDLQQRVDHIFHEQLYGIAITELTSLLSRRSLYCSKYPNGPFSVSHFDDAVGKIRFKNTQHVWKDGRCLFCGVSKDTVLGDERRGSELEAHAYEWIHTLKPQEIFNMKFDVIISNPPYQMGTSDGKNKQAKPIYNLFVEQAKKLNPRYLTMIIPSRWFAGGMGLDKFRDEMMADKHIVRVVDYVNAKECFPQNSISGGVCYFLRDRDNTADCVFTNISNGNQNTVKRPLDEFNVLVRYNDAVSIIHKVQAKKEKLFSGIVSPLMPYGLSTNYRGSTVKKSDEDLALYASDGISYISRKVITKGLDTMDSYKVLMSKTSAEHAGEPGKDGRYRVITSSTKVIGPGDVCTHSYFTIGNFTRKEEAQRVLTYLQTNFVRVLMLMSMSSINLSKLVFSFVPMQNFSDASDIDWDKSISEIDKQLYAKYELNDEEIDFIETLIKPVELG